MRFVQLVILALLPVFSVAQNRAKINSDDFAFVTYLLNKGMKEEAQLWLRQFQVNDDSVAFLKGYTAYNMRQLDTAMYYYSLVKPSSELHNESAFFASLSSAHLANYTIAEECLSKVIDTNAATSNTTAAIMPVFL